MELKHEELLNSTDKSLLTDEINSGIKLIGQLKRTFNMLEKAKRPTQPTIDRINAKDEELVRLLSELKQDSGAPKIPDDVSKEGLIIDKELQAIFDKGKTKITSDELKSNCPKTYSIVWDNYKDGEENGVETSFFILEETEKEVYSLTKK